MDIDDVLQGLIIGRTSAYLCDPKSPDMRLKKDIASTQCHELTHQWSYIRHLSCTAILIQIAQVRRHHDNGLVG